MYLRKSNPRIGIHDPVSIERAKQREFAHKMDTREKPAAPPPAKKGRPAVDANNAEIKPGLDVVRAIDKKRMGRVVCVEGFAVTVRWPDKSVVGYPSHWLVVQKNGK